MYTYIYTHTYVYIHISAYEDKLESKRNAKSVMVVLHA